jgi:hypothetical protein
MESESKKDTNIEIKSVPEEMEASSSPTFSNSLRCFFANSIASFSAGGWKPWPTYFEDQDVPRWKVNQKKTRI